MSAMNDLPRHTGPCPKCRYVRTPADAAPPWQCPSCGVAYHKVTASTSPDAARLRSASRAEAVPEDEGEDDDADNSQAERSIPWKPILAATMLIGGVAYGLFSWQNANAKEAREVREAKARLQQIEQLMDELLQAKAQAAEAARAAAKERASEQAAPAAE